MEKLSVVVPVYNVYPYLRACLDSIINQTYKNLEIIIVNDASPYKEDDEICREYAAKDERVKYIVHEKNKKQGGARNTGIKNATGKYITFIDSDDYLCNINAYEECINAFSKDININTVIFGLNNEPTNSQNLPFNGCKKVSVYTDKFNWYTVQHIYKLDDLINNEICFPENVFYEDNVFLIKYYITIKPLFYGIPKIFYNYRKREEQTTQNSIAIKDVIESHNWIMDYLEEKNLKDEAKHLLKGELELLRTTYNYLLKIDDENIWKKEQENFAKLIDRFNLEYNEINKEKAMYLYGINIKNKEISKSFNKFIECLDSYYEIENGEYNVETKELEKFTKYINKYYKKHRKYKNIKENIIIYKIKREIKRIIKKIKKI